MEITSLKNPKIKALLALQKGRERRLQGLFSIEGIREISLAQEGNFELTSIFVCKDIYQQDIEYAIDLTVIQEVFYVPKLLYNKIAYRETTGGIIAIAKEKVNSLSSLPDSLNPLYLIIEKVEKPGNIGAMLRTADAAGIDGVIICDPATDLFNPNIIRSSLGCVFTLPIAIGSNEEVLKWLKLNKINSYAAMLSDNSQLYIKYDYKKPTAMLLGSEANGLSNFWSQNADEKIIIPMKGKIDSMNVSNAAAILMFEANRQRSI